MPARRRPVPEPGTVRTEVVPLGKLRLDPHNARRHGEQNLAAIRASLERFGQVKPIVVDKRMTVVAGNGTVTVATELGWDSLECKIFEGSAKEARAYAIADNRTGELATWDDIELFAQLGTLGADLRDAAGFDVDALADLDYRVQMLNLDPDLFGGDADATPPGGPYESADIIDRAVQHFRARGFPYPDLPLHEQMQQVNRLAMTNTDRLRQSIVGYHVADGYHPQRFRARAGGLMPPTDAFERDDKIRRALSLIVESGALITDASLLATLAWVAGTQMAAQFRPAFALMYVRRYGPDGGRWLDTSAGYGGRLVAFAASGMAHYVGIDPSDEAIDGNTRMCDALGITDNVTLLHRPAEDVAVADVGGPASCDFALTSPPYFAKELYSDAGENTQSHLRYRSGEAWRTGFLLPMLALQFAALKPGAYSVINIANVKIRTEVYPLPDWTISAALDAGFDHLGNDEFPMPRVPGRGEQSERFEPCIILRKPG